MQEFWAIAALVVIGLAVLRLVLSRRRETRGLRQLAARRRLNFTPEDLIGVYDRYYHLDLLDRGHSRHVWNVFYSSTDVGLLTLFCYTHELGFSVNRSQVDRWVAVIETPVPLRPWRGRRNEAADQDNPGDELRIEAAHQPTQDCLDGIRVGEILTSWPPETEWEIRGPLVAVAVPRGKDLDQVEQLYTHAQQLARRLVDDASLPLADAEKP